MIKLTPLKMYSLISVINTYSCINTTTIKIQDISITPKVLSPCAISFDHLQPQTMPNLVSVTTALLSLELHIHQVRQHAVFHIWLPSLGIMLLRFTMLLHISLVHFFLSLRRLQANTAVCLSAHQLIDIWIDSAFSY